MDLAAVIGAAAAQKIQERRQESCFTPWAIPAEFTVPQFQFAVADAMADDFRSGAAFWYHLGDVVYYFGQEQYYFEQFYDPYRDYNAPIFAIPGNHDGALFQGRNREVARRLRGKFLHPQPTRNPDSQGAVRTTMDQPGVYFTLNAPFREVHRTLFEYERRWHGRSDCKLQDRHCATDFFAAATGGG